MKDLLEKCCGLNVHKDIIVACILAGPIGRATVSEIREFSTLASGLEELRDWITASGCSHVAMESTGIYWIALYEVLEAAPEKLTLLVVNARHMKNVSGKKTDMRDAEWIATLLRAGLLNASFIPEKSIRDRLSEILSALNGTLSAHQWDFLNLMLVHYDTLRFHLAEVETAILNEASPKSSQVEQLITILGISATASLSIIAEIGTDIDPFKTAEHICSWAGLSPGNNESAGNRNSYLSAWYWKLKQKKGSKKAIIALARKLLVIIYTMLKYGTNFDESFFETQRKMHEQNRTSHYIHELEKRGFRIEFPA